jgi:excisionase family DNA binding protein
MMAEFLTTKEAAERLGTTRQTIALYIRQQKIPAVRFGKEYRIPRDVFDRLLQAGLPTESQEPRQQC